MSIRTFEFDKFLNFSETRLSTAEQLKYVIKTQTLIQFLITSQGIFSMLVGKQKFLQAGPKRKYVRKKNMGPRERV